MCTDTATGKPRGPETTTQCLDEDGGRKVKPADGSSVLVPCSSYRALTTDQYVRTAHNRPSDEEASNPRSTHTPRSPGSQTGRRTGRMATQSPIRERHLSGPRGQYASWCLGSPCVTERAGQGPWQRVETWSHKLHRGRASATASPARCDCARYSRIRPPQRWHCAEASLICICIVVRVLFT